MTARQDLDDWLETVDTLLADCQPSDSHDQPDKTDGDHPQ